MYEEVREAFECLDAATQAVCQAEDALDEAEAASAEAEADRAKARERHARARDRHERSRVRREYVESEEAILADDADRTKKALADARAELDRKLAQAASTEALARESSLPDAIRAFERDVDDVFEHVVSARRDRDRAKDALACARAVPSRVTMRMQQARAALASALELEPTEVLYVAELMDVTDVRCADDVERVLSPVSDVVCVPAKVERQALRHALRVVAAKGFAVKARLADAGAHGGLEETTAARECGPDSAGSRVRLDAGSPLCACAYALAKPYLSERVFGDKYDRVSDLALGVAMAGTPRGRRIIATPSRDVLRNLEATLELRERELADAEDALATRRQVLKGTLRTQRELAVASDACRRAREEAGRVERRDSGHERRAEMAQVADAICERRARRAEEEAEALDAAAAAAADAVESARKALGRARAEEAAATRALRDLASKIN